jgi:hypothetical protein
LKYQVSILIYMCLSILLCFLCTPDWLTYLLGFYQSKYTPEELERRRQTVAEFQMELQTIRDVQRAGFVKGYQSTTLVTMAESDMFRGGGGGASAGAGGKGGGGPAQLGGGLGATSAGATHGVSGSRNMDMTDQHRLGLQRLRERDQQIVRRSHDPCPIDIRLMVLLPAHVYMFMYVYCRTRRSKRSVSA